MRGLKCFKCFYKYTNNCRILYGCVDWNSLPEGSVRRDLRRILYGCVDWNIALFRSVPGEIRRILYGCVDWNMIYGNKVMRWRRSHPLWMRGLKYMVTNKPNGPKMSHPLWMRGLKFAERRLMRKETSRILYGCVDWNKHANNRFRRPEVASFMDAWIEIYNNPHHRYEMSSHPLWMRGLK